MAVCEHTASQESSHDVTVSDETHTEQPFLWEHNADTGINPANMFNIAAQSNGSNDVQQNNDEVPFLETDSDDDEGLETAAQLANLQLVNNKSEPRQ
jgi:hypothetical protein